VGCPAEREDDVNRRIRTRTRQKQINILHTTTRKRHSQKQVVQATVWCALVLGMIAIVGAGLHFGIALVLDEVLYRNPLYALTKIDIEPEDHFSPHTIRQAAGLEMGQNLWTLNLPQIAQDLQKLPYVSNAKVERHFPNRITILIHERVPVVQIVGLDINLGSRETFYLDREGVVLKPRADETVPLLPEVIGLTNAELEPGMQLGQSSLKHALEILNAIDQTSLHTSIDIGTINLSDPLSITMVTRQGMSVTFRPDCIDQQLVRLMDIMHKIPEDRTIRTIDLTPDYNVPVTFNE